MNPSLIYRKKFLANQLAFNKKYKGLFGKMASDISSLANDPMAKFTKAFSFSPSIDQKIAAITTEFHDKAKALTEEQIRASWAISNQKNDTIVGEYLKNISGLKTAEKAALFLPNIPALEAFIARDHGTGTLADRIWKVANQARGEMEVHLGMGIANGDSADVISRRIRQYLENPEALFRRVRDKNGKLVASQAMIDNKPGKGVYNSAYKNAMRVSRSETNQAYLLADHIRWQQLDMVIGVEISLSAQHPDYKFVEICEECEGTYPKEFIFTGFHPQCLCNAVPILMPEQDFTAYLRGDAPLKAEQITDYPEGFKNHVKTNLDRYSGYKNAPYFMQDNPAIINGVMKLEGKAALSVVETGIAPIVEKAVASDLAKTLEAKEAEIRMNKTFETAVAFDSKGKILLEKVGGKSSVSFTDTELALFKDSVFTHNHPGGWGAGEGTIGRIGNSFSPADVLTSIKNDVQELRAVTPNFTFVMKRPAKGWMDLDEAKNTINALNRELRYEFEGRIRRGTTTVGKAEMTHWHTIWKRFVKEFEGVEYTKFKAR